jgi:hypothetical protein
VTVFSAAVTAKAKPSHHFQKRREGSASIDKVAQEETWIRYVPMYKPRGASKGALRKGSETLNPDEQKPLLEEQIKKMRSDS